MNATGFTQVALGLDPSEAKFLDIIEAIPIPIAVNGGGNTNIFLNQAFLKTYGYSLEEVASVDAWRFKAYPDPAYRQWQASAWRAHLEKAEREGVFEPLELNISCKDGSMRTVLASAASLGESFERGFLVIHYDLTDRKRFERELRLTQAAIDKSKSAFFRLNPEGVVTYVNDYACQSLGYSREELVGLHVWDFDPAMPLPAWLRFWERVKQKSVDQFESCHRRKDGTIFPIEVTANYIVTDGEEHSFAFVQDITERKRAEHELRLTQTAIDKSKSAFYRISSEGVVTYVNDYACQSLGYSREELIGLHVWDFDPNISPQNWAPHWGDSKRKKMHQFESCHRRKNGMLFPVEVTSNYIAADGEEHTFVFVQDITERKRIEQELYLTHTAIKKSRNAFFWVSTEGRVTYANDHACQSLGYSREELIGMYVWDFDPDFPPEAQAPFMADIRRDGMCVVESRHRRKDGTIFPVEVTANYITAEGKEQVFCAVQDISARKAAESEIHNLAFFDPLTKLPNRRLLMDRLQHALATSARSQSYGAILFLDLDNFKALNDTKGHVVGDLLLIEVAERLRACSRAEDTVARLGGDEFVVVLEDLDADPEHAVLLANVVGDKILASLSEPYLLQDYEHNSSSSIGITLFFGNEDNVDDLLRRADTAMYEAKKAGRGTLRFFDPVMQQLLEERTRLESGMRLALSRQEFQLHYQLQVSDQRQALGVEALIRWMHPKEGLISPARFIPLAEETGLIQEIGQWVLDTACAQVKAWEDDTRLRSLTIAVNVSPYQFRQEDFVQRVIDTVKRHGIDPAKLKLEITESLVLHDVEGAIGKMLELKAFGVVFAMDDFGTGYSSLSYLKRLPFDQIKIDQSFVRDISIGSTDAFIVLTVFTMGKLLGWEVIAEGVESEEQMELLQQLGCQAFQGYFIGKPMVAAEVERMLAVA